MSGLVKVKARFQAMQNAKNSICEPLDPDSVLSRCHSTGDRAGSVSVGITLAMGNYANSARC